MGETNMAEKKILLQLQHLNKYFGKQHILKDVDLTVHENEVVSIIGPSGAGKSTLLRCVNYLEKPESGSYAFDEVTFDAAHVKNGTSAICARIPPWCSSSSICSMK